MPGVIDFALEKSRRFAWFKFYRERDACRQMTCWAVELAERLDQLDAELPSEAVELIAMVRQSAGPRMVQVCRRYITNRSEYDVEISDLDGYEEAMLRSEMDE